MFQKLTRDDLLKNKKGILRSNILEMPYFPFLKIWKEAEYMAVSTVTAVKYLVNFA